GLCFEARPGQPAVRPMLAPFLIGTSESFARLFAMEECTASQVVAQCVSLPDVEEDSDPLIDPGLVAVASSRWAELVSALLTLRESRRELVVELSPEAARILMAFWRQQIKRHPSSLSPHRRR